MFKFLVVGFSIKNFNFFLKLVLVLITFYFNTSWKHVQNFLDSFIHNAMPFSFCVKLFLFVRNISNIAMGFSSLD